jgi:hypothetical protein
VVADFSGGTLSTDGGVLLLRQLDVRLGITRRLAACFYDWRDARFVDHSLEQLLRQRIYGLALGYEDLNDHEQLRRDPLLAAACEKRDPLGQDRCNPADRGIALAGATTLNRLELSNTKATRCHKLPHDPARVQACLLETGVCCLPKYTREVVLDLDGMGFLLHGQQEGRHFSAYYDDYCYKPLYILAGEVLLWAQLRPGDSDGADGVVAALQQIVPAIRRRCKKARIVVRADCDFCREPILAWCEGQRDVYHCVGLAKNSVLLERLAPALATARARHADLAEPLGSVREFAEFTYQTQKTWTHARRVIGKAEVTAQGDNPRFVVTNLPARGWRGAKDRRRFGAPRLYEEFYCARGNMENVLKQQVLDLQADAMSTHQLASNQLRLWFTSFAYVLAERVRALGCRGTELAHATVGTIRLRLFKIAAQVSVSVRRVYVRLSSAYAWPQLFGLCQARLLRLAPADG